MKGQLHATRAWDELGVSAEGGVALEQLEIGVLVVGALTVPPLVPPQGPERAGGAHVLAAHHRKRRHRPVHPSLLQHLSRKIVDLDRPLNACMTAAVLSMRLCMHDASMWQPVISCASLVEKLMPTAALETRRALCLRVT